MKNDEQEAVFYSAMGERIRQQRSRKGMTQAELGGKIGVNESAISLYERGDRKPSASKLVGIAFALGLDPSALINAPPGLKTPIYQELQFPDTHRARIFFSATNTVLFLDDLEIQGVMNVTIDKSANAYPRLTIDLLVSDVSMLTPEQLFEDTGDKDEDRAVTPNHLK